jgi:hypothetical protein
VLDWAWRGGGGDFYECKGLGGTRRLIIHRF